MTTLVRGRLSCFLPPYRGHAGWGKNTEFFKEKKSLSREKQLVSTRSLKVTAGLGQPCQSQGWGPLRGGHSAVLLRSRGQHAALGCPPGVVHLQWCATTQGKEA